MALEIFVLILLSCLFLTEEVNVKSSETPDPHNSNAENVPVQYVSSANLVPVELLNKNYLPPTIFNVPAFTPAPPIGNIDLTSLANGNPLLAALMLTYSLGLNQKAPGFNHVQHLPTNPYVALLLSHYGKYVPMQGNNRGIYGYTAANNYHNNLPFGQYKIYEDGDN